MRFRIIMLILFGLTLCQPILAVDLINTNAFKWPDSLAGIEKESPYKGFYDSIGIDAEKAAQLPPRPDYPAEQFNPNDRKDLLFEPEYVGSALWGRCKDVQVEGNIAYCTFGAGLVILDVTDPTDPILM